VSFPHTREYAQQLDREDVLAGYRKEFYLPKGSIYLDGNSLGLMSVEIGRDERAVGRRLSG